MTWHKDAVFYEVPVKAIDLARDRGGIEGTAI